MSDRRKTLVVERADQLWEVRNRRSFLKLLGLGGTVVLLPSLFTACSDDRGSSGTTGPDNGTNASAVTLKLDSDVGILNYAYALEQLEAAFYTAVVASAAFGGMTAEQKEVMTDLRNHEVVHREFLKAALGANAIGALALNASTVASATASAASILKTAESFEDLGVAAYNGAGKYLASADFLTLAGKIVSVEARHAAAIRDMREGLGLGGTPAGTRFAGDDVVNGQGLDVKVEPAGVLATVKSTAFVTSTVSIGATPSKPASGDAPPPVTP